MRATADDLPILFGASPAAVRATDWGDLRAALVSLPAGTDVTPLLKGLPGDRCQCPHWGYIRKGRLHVIYAEGEETCTAGDVVYMPPGHTAVMEEDVEFIEFSPPREHDMFLQAAQRNAAAGGS